MPNLPRSIEEGAVTLSVEPPNGGGAELLLGSWRRRLAADVAQALLDGHDVVLECSRAGYLDTTTLGTLLRLTRQADELHRLVLLTNVDGEQLEYFTAARIRDRLHVAQQLERRRA